MAHTPVPDRRHARAPVAVSVAAEAGTPGAHSILAVTMDVGVCTAPAVHDHEAQIVVVTRGRLRLAVDGRERPLDPGDAVRIPAGAVRSATAGPEGARLVVVCVPGGLEELVRAMADPSAEDDDIAALMAAAGVRRVAGWGTAAGRERARPSGRVGGIGVSLEDRGCPGAPLPRGTRPGGAAGGAGLLPGDGLLEVPQDRGGDGSVGDVVPGGRPAAGHAPGAALVETVGDRDRFE